MALITAITTSGVPLNVLNPSTWVGGVVPGVSDIAVFPHHPFLQGAGIATYLADSFTSSSTAQVIWNWPIADDGLVRLRLQGNTGFPSISGSVLFKAFPYNKYIKIDYNYMSGASNNTYLHSCSIDRTDTWTTGSLPILNGNRWSLSGSIDTENSFVGPILNGNQALLPFTSSLLPGRSGPMMYELTGSQQWAVGTVRMGDHCHFNITDTSRLILATGSTPCIDYFTTAANYSSLIVKDSATIEVSSSVNFNVQATTTSGIYLHTSPANFVYLSGSANYSSSMLASASSAGDPYIELSNSNAFDIGDYVTIQSDISLTTAFSFTGSDPSRASFNGNYTFPIGSIPVYTNAWAYNNVYHTGTPETDEVVRIEKISGSRAYVSKRLTKEGYIQQDLGTFNYNQFVETFRLPAEYYTGNKRAILVETNHHGYKTGDWLCTGGNSYKILYAGTYLTQSQYLDFTNPTTKATDAFCKSIYAWSGSGYDTPQDVAPPTYSDFYFTHRAMKTGSRAGINSFYLDSASLSQPNTDATNINMRSGFFVSSSYFKEGEIEISGSIVRDFNIYSGSVNDYLMVAWPIRPHQREDYNLNTYDTGGVTQTANRNNIFGVYGDGTIRALVDGHVSTTSRGWLAISGSNKNDYYNEGDFYEKLNPNFNRPNQQLNFKVKVQDGCTELFFNGVSLGRWMSTHDAGGVMLMMRRFASLFTMSIKNLYDIIILDTENPITVGLDTREGGLLESHSAGKTVKWWANEIEDEMGHHNLMWDYWKCKGKTGIMPYLHSFTRTSGSIQHQTYMNAVAYNATWFSEFLPSNSIYAFSQPNAGATITGSDVNHLTFDLGTTVNFDTVGIGVATGGGYASFEGGYTGDYVGWSTYMPSMSFQVSDTPDSWETVYAYQSDRRISAGSGAIRYYTFPSGSVNKRFIRYRNMGGRQRNNGVDTFNLAASGLSHFGVYNFATASNGIYGSTNTTNQIKLYSAKNFKVGDSVMLWSKQYGAGTRTGAASQQNTTVDFYSLNTTRVVGATNTNNMLSGSFIPGQASASFGVTGGYKRSYDIIAISGSVITLDRPVAADYIGRGTVVMKTNRGNVQLKKNIFNDHCGIHNQVSNNFIIAQNASIEGMIRSYPAGTSISTPTVTKFEDIGNDFGVEGNALIRFNGASISRNIVTANGLFYDTTNIPQTFVQYPTIQFNTFQRCTGGLPLGITTDMHSTYNHNTYLGMQGAIGQSADTTIARRQWNKPISYIKNNFFQNYENIHHFVNNYLDEYSWDHQIFTGNVAQSLNNSFSGRFNNATSQVNAAWNNTSKFKYDVAYMNQHWSPQSITNNQGRSGQGSAVIAGPLSTGTYIPVSPAMNGKDFIAIGTDFTNYNVNIIRKNGDWYDVSYIGDNSIVGGYRTMSSLGCSFLVYQPTTASISLSFDYMLSPWQKYFTMNSQLSAYWQYYSKDYHIPRLVFLGAAGDSDTIVLDEYDLTYNLNSGSMRVTFNRNYNLQPGNYALNLNHMTHYQGQYGLLAWSYKNMDFKIASADKNNIKVTKNTWDIHKLLDGNDKLQVNEFTRPDNIGPNTVSRTVNDLTTTVRFNNVKL